MEHVILIDCMTKDIENPQSLQNQDISHTLARVDPL